jgi:membrane-associated phospholipid phosphatase
MPQSDVHRLRSSEQFLIVYFTYVAITAAWFFSPVTEVWKPWALAGATAGILYCLSGRESVWRDFAPAGFTLAAYREMNWFTPSTHDHHLEKVWVVWDRWLLNDYHLRAAIESLGALFPSYFELCYALVYAVAPASIAFLFVNHRRDRMNTFWIAYLTGTLGAYAMFPFFPSEPPRTVFPSADFPNVVTDLRQLNLWIVGGYGIHSSVFPSAHVSSALSAAWGLGAAIAERPWIGRLMAFYGFSVAIATVYGRYHYAADAVAGVGVSLLAIVALVIDQKRGRSGTCPTS